MSQEPEAHLEGSSAIAQEGSTAAGERSVVIQSDATAPIVTGDYNTVIWQGAKVLIPGPESVAAHRQALRSRLEREARVRWGGMSTYIQEEGAALPIEASPYQTGRLGPRENLLGLLHAADRLLVLGEPGSGKTVALERLAWELCGGQEPAVPVLVRLFHGKKPGCSGLWPGSFTAQKGRPALLQGGTTCGKMYTWVRARLRR